MKTLLCALLMVCTTTTVFDGDKTKFCTTCCQGTGFCTTTCY